MALTKNSRLLLIGSVVLALLVGGAGVGFVLYKRKHRTQVMTPEESKAEGTKLFESRKFLEAYRLLGYAAQKRPEDLDVQWLAARAALQLHRRDYALPHVKAVWEGGRKNREVYQSLVEASQFKNTQERLKSGLAWLKDLPEGAERRELEADLYFSSENPAEALRRWTELFAASPTPRVATKIGLAQVVLGRPAEAAKFLTPLRKTPNLDSEGYSLLGTIRADMDDRKGAEEVFEEGRQAFPQAEDIRLNEAAYLISEDRTADAVTRLDPLKVRSADLNSDHRHHQARILLGFAHATRGEMTPLSVLEELAQGEAPWLEGERLLYRVLRVSLEKKEPLKEDLLKARKLLGTLPVVEWLSGRYHSIVGKWPEAVAAYRGVTGLLARSPLLQYELAQALYRAGKLDEAIETLRRLHSRKLYSKASMELFRNLAIQKGLAKESQEAQAFLESQFKDDPGIEFAGGLMALASGNLTEAARVFDDMAAKNPGNEDVESAKLSVLMAKKDYDGVLKECATGKAAAATRTRFRAMALLRLNRLDEAEEALSRATAERPDWVLQILYGNLLLSRNKVEPAAKAYASALQSQPKSEVAHLGLAMIAARSGRWKEVLDHVRPLTEANLSIPIAYLLLGEAELNDGHPDRALRAADRVLTMVSEDPGGLLLQGAANLAMGKAAEAEETLLKCSAKKPDDPGVQWQLAQARIARGAYPEALAGVETALARGTADSLPLQQVRIILLAQCGRGPEARALLERLTPQLQPLQVRLCDAWLLQREGQLPLAAESLRPVLDQRPAALVWAELKIRQGQTDGVLETLDRHPLDSAAWSRMAELARTKGMAPMVVECCRRALKSRPEDPTLLNNLAWFAVQLPSFDAAEAIGAARKASSLLPSNPAVLHTFGTVLLKCKKERDCVDVLVRAASVTERSPKLMLLLAQAYEKTDNTAKALQWYSSCANHPETAAVEQGELSRTALQEQIDRLRAKPKSP